MGGKGYMSKNENNPMQGGLSPICGAKTRSGMPCANGRMANGRCRMHGGKSTGAPIGNKNALKNGRFTAEVKNERASFRKLLHSL